MPAHTHTHTVRTFTSLLTDYGLWSHDRALAGPSVPAEISTAGAYQCGYTHKTHTQTRTYTCTHTNTHLPHCILVSPWGLGTPVFSTAQ